MNTDEKRTYLKSYKVQHLKLRRMKEMMDMCPENKEKYQKEYIHTLNLRNKIEEEIDGVDGAVLTEILSQKYICGRSLEQISFAMNYSKRQIERLHLKALDMLKIS